jgi:hypothetical protein
MQEHQQGGVTLIGVRQAYSGRGIPVSIRGYLAIAHPASQLEYFHILHDILHE